MCLDGGDIYRIIQKQDNLYYFDIIVNQNNKQQELNNSPIINLENEPAIDISRNLDYSSRFCHGFHWSFDWKPKR